MIKTEEIKKQLETIKAHSLNEFKETKQLLRLLTKFSKTKEERSFIKHQSLDLLKITVVISVGALPGGTVAVAFIELGFRKINRSILPSKYVSEEEKEEVEKRE